MIPNAFFLNVLALLVIAGNTFTSVTAIKLAPTAPPDYSSKDRKAICQGGSCKWICPDDWCWVAHNVYKDGWNQWEWLSCQTADDCSESKGDMTTCKHSAWNVFSGDGWSYPYSLNCDWISPEHQAVINEENRKKDEENRKKGEENRKHDDEENRRRVIKCFKPDLKPNEVEQALRDHYHPEVPVKSPYRVVSCLVETCEWACPDSFCEVVDKRTVAGKSSLQWRSCKNDDDCKPDGGAMVCGKLNSKPPLEGPEPSCSFNEEDHRTYTELKRWMKCVAPNEIESVLESDLREIKFRSGNALGQEVIDDIRKSYYL